MISYDMLLDLPVKAQIRHKNSPDHWCCVPNKSGEFIALNKTVYRLNRKNSCVLSSCNKTVVFRYIRRSKEIRRSSVEITSKEVMKVAA